MPECPSQRQNERGREEGSRKEGEEKKRYETRETKTEGRVTSKESII